nr:hypothetical protein [Tanacetum cinerariifolium]
MEKVKSIENDEAVDKSVIEPSELNIVEPIELVDEKEEMEDGTGDDSARSTNEEIIRWILPSSQPIVYYLKYEINEKIIEGLVYNYKYNNSLLATRLGKMDHETYNSLPAGLIDVSLCIGLEGGGIRLKLFWSDKAGWKSGVIH